MPAATRASTLLVLLVGLLAASSARAEESTATGPWRPERVPDVGVADLVVIGVGVGIQVAAEIVPPQPRHARGGWLFDEGARDVLRARTSAGRSAARTTSDVGVSLVAAWPFLLDALVTAWWYRGSGAVARDMALVDAEAMAVTMGLRGIAEYTVSRERPYGRECGGELPQGSSECESDGRYRSFFSGHSSVSFTGAGLVCSQHLRLGLLGPPGDAISCAGAVGIAFVTASLRVVGDMHYATDVLTGFVVGASSGLLVPLLRSKAAGRSTGAARLHLVAAVAGGAGLGVGGAF